jgi:hypothetical protein
MNITITLQADSRLLNALETFASAFSNLNVTPVRANTETAPNATADASKKMSVVKQPVKNNEETVQPGATNTTTVSNDEPLDMVKVRAIAAEMSQAGKKEKIKGVLKEMNVSRVTDLQENQFAEFVQKIKAV